MYYLKKNNGDKWYFDKKFLEHISYKYDEFLQWELLFSSLEHFLWFLDESNIINVDMFDDNSINFLFNKVENVMS